MGNACGCSSKGDADAAAAAANGASSTGAGAAAAAAGGSSTGGDEKRAAAAAAAAATSSADASDNKSEHKGDSSESSSGAEQTLVSIPFFNNMEGRHLKQIGKIFHRRHCRKDEIVVSEGASHSCFHVIVNGHVEVLAKDHRGTYDVVVLLLLFTSQPASQ
jgi:hypothetical protein